MPRSFPKNPSEEVYFKLKDLSKETEFVKFLFKNKIPFVSYCGDVFATSHKDKLRLEKAGFEFSIAEIVNLSELTLEERNAYKDKCRSHWLASRDQAIDELLAKYG